MDPHRFWDKNIHVCLDDNAQPCRGSHTHQTLGHLVALSEKECPSSHGSHSCTSEAGTVVRPLATLQTTFPLSLLPASSLWRMQGSLAVARTSCFVIPAKVKKDDPGNFFSSQLADWLTYLLFDYHNNNFAIKFRMPKNRYKWTQF